MYYNIKYYKLNNQWKNKKVNLYKEKMWILEDKFKWSYIHLIRVLKILRKWYYREKILEMFKIPQK